MLSERSDCLISLAALSLKRREYDQQGQQVVFTNGCFDILHCGHVHLLEQARAAGDVLIVGLNSDRSIQMIKGPDRPIVPQEQRARLLLALKPVDHVILFDQPTPAELIQTLYPDILVKGSDWGTDNIVGADFVRARGGKVIQVQVLEGNSTTDIIATICNRFG